MGKKLFFILLTFSTITFANTKDSLKHDNTFTKLSKIISTKHLLSEKEEVRIYKFTYNENNFIKQITIDKIDTYGAEAGLIKQFNREEIDYIYNSKNQIEEKRFYDYYGSEKRERKTICYTYDTHGYMISSIVNAKMSVTYAYEYNEACFLGETKRMLSDTQHDIVWNYVYDKENHLLEVDLKSGDNYSDCTAYLFDNKNNPNTLNLPKQYCLAFPEQYGKNNPIKIEEISSKYSKTNTFEYTYNTNNYPEKSINKYYENDNLKNTTTIEYFY